MQEVKKYPHATFCLVELSTTNIEAAKSFYCTLFGWTSEDFPAADGSTLAMMHLNGKSVAALQGLNRESKVPPHWLPYISVDDVDAICKKVPQLGGAVVTPFDAETWGKGAIIRDVGGAHVGLWQAGTFIGASYVNMPGALMWNELLTLDVDGSRRFYTELLGWTWEVPEGSPMPYTLFQNDGRHAAGMMEINEEWGDVPAHWSNYFAVEDCDKATAIVKAEGGSIPKGPFDIPEIGRMAVVKDPQGAYLSVMQSAHEFTPPPGI